ncbi:hypothetical protein K3N28_00800 [Glycomyces sp. TRM65418]|uniref:hypothetical protein n=1 Tax=Glycomyces sp. TRM65418 TaxID=2867006 RepID=UPI001CE6B1D9|nr:hypothetical protein [Glycomyces sp. TRM65418]MCC3761613.1 hypothetical protein [Glycomyces sp. TRM65418]QZD55709.1 hypothetical protein K3N28_00790 [Glycomyces sp. TRM65418]
MATPNQLRTTTLALPETAEGSHFGMAAFSVRGRGFASLSEDGRVQLRMPPEQVEAAPAVHPAGERLSRSGRTIGLRVPLAALDGRALHALVRASWRHRAPRRLVAAVDQAEAAATGEGDLPAAIGRPATRALHGAGLTTLDRVAARSEAELLRLHGVGPKTIRVLEQVLAEQGRSLRA